MDRLKILVVDDEPGIRSGIVRILRNYRVSYPFMDEDFEFDLLEAATGEEAIQLIDKNKPDIVLLDNKLPGIQGIGVLEYIREKNYDSVVAMITSYASLDLAIKATGFGAHDFIPKPFTPQELKSSIDNITKQLLLRRITRTLQEEGKKIRYQFLSVLSHELKTPLNSIEGYLRMMQERQMGNDLAAYDQMIDRALSRIQGMRNLIMDLLDFTKIRFEKRQDQIRIVNVGDMARSVVQAFQPYAIQKGIEFHISCNDPVLMEIDPSDLEIVMNNIISNAVKYNTDNGKVIIEINDTDKEVTISVADTGIGMTKEEIEKVFREFIRIKNEKTKNIPGSGLGLAIVKRITELYNGSIQVESEPEKGSIFRIILPKKQKTIS